MNRSDAGVELEELPKTTRWGIGLFTNGPEPARRASRPRRHLLATLNGAVAPASQVSVSTSLATYGLELVRSKLIGCCQVPL